MTVHSGVDPRMLQRMADQVGQLVDPIQVPVRQRVRGVTRWTVVTHPPLLAQLRAACEPGAAVRGPERRPGPRSKPAASVDPMDALRRVYDGLGRWRARVLPDLGVVGADGWASLLRALVGVAPTLAPSIAVELAADIHRWWRAAAVQSGWRPDDLEKLQKGRL